MKEHELRANKSKANLEPSGIDLNPEAHLKSQRRRRHI